LKLLKAFWTFGKLIGTFRNFLKFQKFFGASYSLKELLEAFKSKKAF
jgi:hypothetical protein